jgi:hypothetical protein
MRTDLSGRDGRARNGRDQSREANGRRAFPGVCVIWIRKGTQKRGGGTWTAKRMETAGDQRTWHGRSSSATRMTPSPCVLKQEMAGDVRCEAATGDLARPACSRNAHTLGRRGARRGSRSSRKQASRAGRSADQHQSSSRDFMLHECTHGLSCRGNGRVEASVQCDLH